MADIQTSAFVATDNPSAFPDQSADTYGSYSAFAVTDEAACSFIVPDNYVQGSDLTLKIYEHTLGTADNHKWQATVAISGQDPETHTAEYTSSATADAQSIREFAISTGGMIDSVPPVAGDLVTVILARIAATSDEDSNPIRIYSVTAVVESPSFSLSGCGGRVGAIVDEVLLLSNEALNRDFVKPEYVITWINRCTKTLAQEDVWVDQETITWPSGSPEYVDLLTEITGFQRIVWHGVRYLYPDETRPHRSLYQANNFADFVQSRRSRRRRMFLVESNRLYIWPVPANTDQFVVTYSYCPTDCGCSKNYDPPVPAAHDAMYVAFCLLQVCLMDRTNKSAAAQAPYYMGSFKDEKRKLKLALTPAGYSFRPYR